MIGNKFLKTKEKVILLAIILSLFIILGCSLNTVEAKRGPPKEVEPVIYNGIKYIAPLEKMGYVEAFNNTTGEKLREIKVYDVKIDSNMEADVQWIFITNLSIVNGKLSVINEAGVKYEIDIEGPDATPTSSPTQAPTWAATATKIPTLIPTEKAPGFEIFLAISIFLAVYAYGRKRK
jgi:hypothetical protein